VITLDPITGEWSWDGVTRNDNPTYRLDGIGTWPMLDSGSFQNDFVYEHAATSCRSKTVTGYAFSYFSEHYRQRNYVLDGIYYDFANNYTPPAYTFVNGWASNSSARNRSNQVYIYEVLHLFEDRLMLSGSLSQNRYFSESFNNRSGSRSQNKAEATLPSGGIVYKIRPGVSLYYGYSKQEQLGAPSVNQGIPPHTRPSRQHEWGARVRLFDGRLYATLVYFDILQESLWTQNMENYKTPVPPQPLPAVRANRTSKGVEFELTWSPTKDFSPSGSFTDFENRDQENMRLVRVPERTAAIWGSYAFPETGPLRGLRVGLGANYVGERPGGDVGLYTSPPAGYDPVRIQHSFWMTSYTVVNASANYRFDKHWSAQLTVNNLLNEDYIAGSFLRQLWVGARVNPRLTVRYEF